VLRRSAKSKIGKAKSDARQEFSYFLIKFPKIQYSNFTNMDFSQKFQK